MRLAGAERAEPFCRARQRAGERPAHKHKRQASDEQSLDRSVHQ